MCAHARSVPPQVRAANVEIARLARRLSASEARAQVEKALVAEEMRGELISREANAARTAERFRILAEKQGGAATHERAVNAAAVVEMQVAEMCSHPLNRSNGTALLVERARTRGA